MLFLPGDSAYMALNDLHSIQRRRIRKILIAMGCLQGFVALFWGFFFSLLSRFDAVLLDVATLGVAVFVVLMAHRHRQRLAAWTLIPLLYINLLAMSALFDIPSPEVPRSAHLYLLALAIGSYIIFQHERHLVRRGVPILCLLTFFVFASSNIGFITSLAIPEHVRVYGTWVNSGLALLGIAILMALWHADFTARAVIEGELNRAINEKEFLLHFQPQFDLDGQIIGAEALLRWMHPERGFVSPAEFIPAAEKTGLILQIGHWVLNTACVQIASWPSSGPLARLTISVNVSAYEFRQTDFVSRVRGVVEQSGIAPSRLKIELTESMLARDIDDMIAKMESLKAYGVGFSLDDFGTGFSSLNYLKRLPLDQLKIDQSFVRDVLVDASDAAIARTVISLGHNLGLAVIAEGVETQGQLDFLRANGCHAFQGYLFSRPVPIADFEKLVLAKANK